MRDVTEVELAYQPVRESEERFRTLPEQSRDGVARVIDGKMEYANPAWFEIRGYSQEEIDRHSPLEFIAAEDRNRMTNG